MVWKVAERVSVPIVGMGGIVTAQDALEFLIAGASAIQVGTTTFINPWAGLEIVDGISEYCNAQDISSLSQIVGSLDTDPLA